MYVTLKGHQRKVYNGLLVENPNDHPVKLWIASPPAVVESEPPPPKSDPAKQGPQRLTRAVQRG